MPVEKNKKVKIGIVLLAAGESSRLGQPKQMLQFAGKTLLQHSLKAAEASKAHATVVVLGAHVDAIKDKVQLSTHVVTNTNWKEGMASSIRHGIKALMEVDPGSDAVILMVCDQPYVSSVLLNNLIATHQRTGKRIVACSYDNTVGPPALFHNTLYPELLLLNGDVGAKTVVKQHANEVAVIAFPEGDIDIDTSEDLQKLSKVRQ